MKDVKLEDNKKCRVKTPEELRKELTSARPSKEEMTRAAEATLQETIKVLEILSKK